jgi:hypothetical protein
VIVAWAGCEVALQDSPQLPEAVAVLVTLPAVTSAAVVV